MNFFQFLAIFMALLPIAVSAIETETTAIYNAAMTTVISTTTTAAAVTTAVSFTSAQSSAIKTHYSLNFEIPSSFPDFYLHIRDLIYTSNLKLRNVRYTLERIINLTKKAFNSAIGDALIIPNNSLPAAQKPASIPKALPENPIAVYIYSPPAIIEANVCPANLHTTESFYPVETKWNFKIPAYLIIIVGFVITIPFLVSVLLSELKRRSQIVISNPQCLSKIQNEYTVKTALNDLEMLLALPNIADFLKGLDTDDVDQLDSSETSSVYSENTDTDSLTSATASPETTQKKENNFYNVEDLTAELDGIEFSFTDNVNPDSPDSMSSIISQNFHIDPSTTVISPLNIRKKRDNRQYEKDTTTQNQVLQTNKNDDVKPSLAETNIDKAETNPSDQPESTQNEIEYAENAIDRDSDTFKVSDNQEEFFQDLEAQIAQAKIDPHENASLQTPTENHEPSLVWNGMETFDISCFQSDRPSHEGYAQQALELLCDDIDKISMCSFCEKFNPREVNDFELESAYRPNTDQEMPYLLRAKVEFDNFKEALVMCDNTFDIIAKGLRAIQKCEKRFMKPENWNKLNLLSRMDDFYVDFGSGQDLEYMILRHEVSIWVTIFRDANGKKKARVNPNIPDEESLIARIKDYMYHRAAYRSGLCFKVLRIIEDYNGLIPTFVKYIDDDKVDAYEAKVKESLEQSDCK